jgi:RNA polymerase sigma-70 factor (ECF subfamily)
MTVPPQNPAENQSVNGSAIDWPGALAAHRRWLRTVVLARVGDAHTADDIMQDVAEAVLKQNSRPTDTTKIAPWLYRIALRRSITHCRKAGRQRRLIGRFAVERTGPKGPADPREWVLQCERDELVKQALSRLGTKDREVLSLKYTEGWSYRQMAEHLGVTEKTIERRLARAREALRSQLRTFGIRGLS